MFQLSLLGAGIQDLVKPAPGGRPPGPMGLGSLLQANDTTMAGLSGELQSLLMQLSPEMLQRLNELLQGGMDLPQAASVLLEEGGAASQEGVFATFLKQRIPVAAEAAGGPTPAAGPPTGRMPLPGPSLPEPLLPTALATVSAALPVNTPTGQSAPLPTALAGNLLNMGVPQPVGGRGWDSAIADRVIWMVQGEQQFARLKLNPPHLGPLEVRVSLQQDQASVSFLAQHAAVREALEAALPRLREMFEQQSLQLVRTDVGDPGAGQGGRARDPGPEGAAHAGGWDAGKDDAGVADEMLSSGAVTDGLVDLFV